uniref:XPGN domain-containing protein n=1 Tax=Elaeophora elaphi TaxID=1147741 RepID=A0A0R3RZ29_9BILA
MGIQGLWQVLEPVAEPVTLESLEGKRLAVDISIWLHQAAYGYSEHQLNTKCPHLSLVLRRLSKLLFYKIRPLFVFDGPNVPVFKKKLLRDRQVKRYVEELTMTKAQKHVLQQLASSQLRGGEQRLDELSEMFVSQTRKRRDNDLFDVSIPSTSRDEIKHKNTSNEETAAIYSSFESSRSSEFDQTEFESLTTRDERVDYLLAVRDKVRGLKLREVPDDSKAFSDLQIDRLLKRNKINDQLQLLKNEALKLRVFSSDGKQSCSTSNIKLAAMEGLNRVHIITEDDEVQIIDEEKEAKKKDLMDSLAWPVFLEKMKEKEDERTKKVFSFREVGNCNDLKTGTYCDDDDDDDALQEAIHASLLENSSQSCSKFQMVTQSYNHESKGDMIERLRTAFTERAKDLHHDTWSSSASESSDEFVEIFPELSDRFVEEIDPSSKTKTAEVSTESLKGYLINDKGHIGDKNRNFDDSHDESILQGSSRMCINPADDMDIFASAKEEGVYKDCQDLLRICGVPFVIAPGEAEAQCCELERLGLVQGIISDDSDVWLFGATIVYKNMFNQKRRLQMYSMETIQNQLGLSRWEAVQIALLSGGDYTNGLEGVGVVAALELISEFAITSRQVDIEPSQQAFENLHRISTWLNHRAWNNLQSSNSCISDQDSEKKFVENTRRLKLRRLIEKNNVAETLEAFPSREVFNAYAEPLVDNSTEKPKWRNINMEELELFVWEKLGWDRKHLEKQTNHSFLKWNEYLNPTAGGSGQSYQMHITSFAHRLQKSEQDQRLFLTARVQAALQRLITIKSTLKFQFCISHSLSVMRTTERLKRKRPSKCVLEKTTKRGKERTIVPANKQKKLAGAKSAEDNFTSKELQLSEESSDDDI